MCECVCVSVCVYVCMCVCEGAETELCGREEEWLSQKWLMSICSVLCVRVREGVYIDNTGYSTNNLWGCSEKEKWKRNNYE